MTPAATLRPIAQEFREHPEMWTRGACARNARGFKCDYAASDAVRWCQLGRLVFYGAHASTAMAMHKAAEYLFPRFTAVGVNDKLGREATIQMLELAADMMEGVK